MYYDVVIIGSGPAGLKCAEDLASTNFQVLLIEKNLVIGPKTCGGGLTELNKDYSFPQEKLLGFNEQIINLNGREYRIKLKNPLQTIDRYDLGQYQLAKIENCPNIIIKRETTVTQIFNDHLITDKNENIAFKYLIGADGVNSLVRKYLGLKTKIMMGVQYIIPQKYQQMIWFLNPHLIKTGYGWIFPHLNFISAGVFYDPKIVEPLAAKTALHNFLDQYLIDYHNAAFEAAPINYFYQGHCFSNIFLVGGAAGLTSKNTGEGISAALTSGAETVKYLLNNRYRFPKLKRILRLNKRKEVILNIFNRLPLLQTLLFKIFIRLLRRHFFQKFYGN